MAQEKSKSNLGHTVVRPCTCASAFQDERYGSGQRVHNVGKEHVYCTVCGTSKGRS